jgi:hypothetical protein
MICKSCQGLGYFYRHKHSKFKDKDNWDVKYDLGDKYQYKICRKCNGTGEFDERHNTCHSPKNKNNYEFICPYKLYVPYDELSYALPCEEIEHKKHNDHKELLLKDIVKIKVKT